MGPAEREDARDDFEQYPYGQPLGGERIPSEPTNVELEASARSGVWPRVPVPEKTWAAVVAMVAFFVVLIVVTLALFPLGTWEFGVGP